MDYVYDNEKLFSALQVFVKRYASEFDITEEKSWKLISNLRLEVSIIPRVVSSAFDVEGKLIKDAGVSGLALTKNWIWVEIKTKNIYNSSLVHELVHIIIWREQTVHGDPDHEGKEYSGWSKKHTDFIKSVNLELMDLNL